MKPDFKINIVLAGMLVCLINLVHAQHHNKTPIEITRQVADKMIRTTPFQYQLIQQKPVSSFDHIKTLNLARTFGTNKPGVAYAMSAVYSPSDTTVILQISHSDGMKIWFNKVLVYEKTGNRKPYVKYKERAIDLESEFTVALKKGRNDLLLKSETRGEDWIFYLRCKENGKNLKLSTEYYPVINPEISKLSNWLVIGPFPNATNNGYRTGLSTPYEPEKEFEIGKLYTYAHTPIAWTIPKIELTVDGMGSQGAWPGDHNFAWNYHAGGTAWAMGYLGLYTKEQKYIDYNKRYVDFYIDKESFLKFQKYNLGGMGSGDCKIAETYMLDFTAAPTLSMMYQLEHGKNITNKKEIEAFYSRIKEYTINQQFRLPGGNFARETPHKYTTWADDMYMGIPFIVHASLLATSATEKNKLMEDAVNQTFAFLKQVWDPEYNLIRQTQYSDRKVKIPFWSRANGWGLWAVTEVLTYLPKNHPKYQVLLAHYKNHIDALINYQDKETGFWHNLVDKPDSYPETSGTAIFTMAIARGINQGWLNKAKYKPYTVKGWQAVASNIEADGTLHGTCIGTNMSENIKDYYARPVMDDDTHGILPVLFTGIEVDKMMK